MRAYSPVVLFPVRARPNGLFLEFTINYVFKVLLVISLVIYTRLLPIIFCRPKFQQIRVFQFILNLTMRFSLGSVG